MKNLKDNILEKLIISKDSKIKKPHNVYYALLGVYEGYDYLVDTLGDTMITGDSGSGPNIFILPYNVLITLNKKYFIIAPNLESGTISIWNIPEEYQDDIDKFENDYENGTINLEDDCYELSDDEYNEILNKMKK